LHLSAELLDSLNVWPLNLEAHRRFNAGKFHVQPVFDRHGPGIGKTGELQLRVHLLDQLFVCHAWRPVATRLEHNSRVIHIEGRVVGGAVGAPDGAENGLDLREGSDDTVLFLHKE
jgi:hypothetical protein